MTIDLSHLERDVLTYGESLGPAMKITEQSDADAYWEAYVVWAMRTAKVSRVEAEKIGRANFGYYAGYYDHATRQRVERLFHCAHPVFGAAGAEPIAPEKALSLGIAMGSALAGRGTPREG